MPDTRLPDIRSVAVFCGASTGHAPAHAVAARALGAGLAAAGMRLVYGGGRIGLMGAVAEGATAAGGVVTGVIPRFLMEREAASRDRTDLVVTETMHARKQIMAEAADAFVSFSGGLGTMDETFEILTWKQLGLHDKPIVICDVDGAAGPLVGLIEAIVAAGFADPAATRRLYTVAHGVPETLRLLGA